MPDLIMALIVLFKSLTPGDGDKKDAEQKTGNPPPVVREAEPPPPLERSGSVLDFPPDHDLPQPFYPVLPRTKPPAGRRGSGAPERLPPGEKSSRSWRAFESSLALYDDFGVLRSELGLGSWRTETETSVIEHSARGGISRNGRFAWYWQKVKRSEPGVMGKTFSMGTMLVYLGTAGQILWRSALADSPAELPPLVQSADGETALVIEREKGRWRVAARTYTGNDVMLLNEAGRVERMELEPGGRFASVLWSPADKPLAYTFLDLHARRRYDLPAADVPLGKARITSKGAVLAGRKTVFRFQGE